MKRNFLPNLLVCLAIGLALVGLATASPAARAMMPTVAGPAGADAAVGTSFTYQGRLVQSGAPVTGSCNFQFSLWDADSGGAQVGTTQTKTGVTVDKGYFTVALDFGANAFNGEARYLAIAVDCGGGYTGLNPRVTLTPAPYALALPGLRTEQNATSHNVIGGYAGNFVTVGAVGAVIGGGGDSFWSNRVTDDYGVVSGGYGNGAGDGAGMTNDRRYATVGGGMDNYATGAYSFVGGGTGNRATGNSATVGGGGGNTASNVSAMVSGGANNTASGYYATVSGGTSNTASGNYSFAAGYRAKATHLGSFVWADTTIADFNSTADNQFAVRATGGVVFSTGSAAVQVNGSTVWHAGNDGSGSGLDADLLDGYHAGNSSGQVPVSNGTLNTNLNADLLDGYHAGNGSGQAPVSNGTLNTNLNADLLDGQHGSYYQNASNVNAGTLGVGFYSAYADLGAEGYLDNDASSDLLTRGQSDARYWILGGNTVAADGVLGTANNYALDLRVNNARALRLEPNATSPNVVGGYSGNGITAGAYGATVGGGGNSSTANWVTDNYGTVGGGVNNIAGDNAGSASDRAYATVSGGSNNRASGMWATVGGGVSNIASGDAAIVAGGYDNTASAAGAFVGGGGTDGATFSGNTANAIASTISGGYGNSILSYAPYATIGGGYGNLASDDYATVGGGYNNTAGWVYATVGGGYNNTADGGRSTVGGGDNNHASASYATVPGGQNNIAAGYYSLAAGRRAQANNQGCFVWGDTTDADITCDTDNRTIFRSSGGYYIYTNSSLTSGMYLAAGGSAWNVVSNRALKENFTPVDTQALLERLTQIEISAWNYRSQDPAIRHIGPMADDFNSLVDGLGGEGADHINSLDADGVALAASQGLYQLAQEQGARLARLAQENAVLQAANRAQQAQLDALLARVEALEDGRSAGRGPQPRALSWLSAWPGLLAVMGVVGAWVWGRRGAAPGGQR